MADASKKGKGGGGAKQPQPNNAQQNQQKQAAPSKQANTSAPAKNAAPAKQAKPADEPKVKESKQEQVQPVAAPTETAPAEAQSAAGESARKSGPRTPKEYVQGRGTVKAVLSGDLLIVLRLEPGKPPQEREIALSNVQAPKLGRRNREKKDPDEEFAFASREFLRKQIIGRPAAFTIESKGTKGGREYGVVVVTAKDGKELELATLMVGEGWARVRRRELKDGETQGPLRADVEELMKLEEEAKRAGKGVHTNNGKAKKESLRPTTDPDYAELYDKLKSAPQQAVVERVLYGNTVILTLLPSLTEVRLILSGVDTPQQRTDGDFEPFGREAKFCTEYHLLNRDVQVILEGADRYNLFGTLDYMGNNISEELLKRGLAKYVEWSGSRTAFADRLKKAEQTAKDKKLCLWSLPAQPQAAGGRQHQTQDATGQMKLGREINGIVTRIISAGLIEITDAQGKAYECTLSSVMVPRGGPLKPAKATKEGEDKGEAKAAVVGEAQAQPGKPKNTKEQKEITEALERTYAWQGKELLRRRLIGQKVRAVLDYIQPAQPQQQGQQGKGPNTNKNLDKDRYCYSVYLGNNNVAVELTAAGFATARAHRGGEERSKDYEDILKAEALAKKAQRGRHTPENKASPLYINDISQDPETAKRFPIRKGRQRGVVLKVFNAGKYKLYVAKENCELNLSLSGVKTPRTGEPFAEEALRFVETKINQREIEFEIFAVDKGGNFVGTAWNGKDNLSTQVLREGYGQLLRGIAKEGADYEELNAAEEAAKKTRRNIWKDWDEAAEEERRAKRRAEMAEARGEKTKNERTTDEFIDVMVTEILDANRFFIQVVGDEAARLEDLMANLSTDDATTEGFAPKVGSVVRAQYSVDDQWYRATIQAVEENGNLKVFYGDYGNSETIPASRVAPISAKYNDKSLPLQAKEAHLAYVKPPAISDDYGTEAAEFVRDLVEGKTMMANIEYRDDNGHIYLSLGDRDSGVHVNAALVRAGLALVKKPRGVQFTKGRKEIDQIIAKLKEEESVAKTSRTNMWEYGDPGDDDDEAREFGHDAKKKAPPAKKAAASSSPAVTAKKE
eukprot:TRINITY_DN511_c0_g1_i1.p1 TRINITY_DN511_c0_g1~~TRINITY_DN511_c0_g1_i1.p1  ORF type:complete len:1076 (-),score=417.04 TRINITY_DN511_c0_g1_i1:108-3335(-)